MKTREDIFVSPEVLTSVFADDADFEARLDNAAVHEDMHGYESHFSPEEVQRFQELTKKLGESAVSRLDLTDVIMVDDYFDDLYEQTASLTPEQLVRLEKVRNIIGALAISDSVEKHHQDYEVENHSEVDLAYGEAGLLALFASEGLSGADLDNALLLARVRKAIEQLEHSETRVELAGEFRNAVEELTTSFDISQDRVNEVAADVQFGPELQPVAA